MEIRITQSEGTAIAEIVSDEILVRSVQDMLDLMVNVEYQGAESFILIKDQLSDEFYDLKTRGAGDILQKVVTYHKRLAIVGDFDTVESDSLRAFIRECNRGQLIFFLKTPEEAIQKLRRH